MASIFSTQNLQTFLRRKYFRPAPPPPSRPPPGPPGRDGRRSPRSGRSPPEDDSDDVDLVSSAMLLLKSVVTRWSLVVSVLGVDSCWPTTTGQRPNGALLCRRRGNFPGSLSGWRWRCGFALCVLDRLDFVQAFLLFIDAHGKKLDHRFGNAQTALQFMNQATAAFDRQQHVDAVVKFPDGVSQPPLAHAFHVLHVPGRRGHRSLQRGNKFVLVLFRHIGADDEH